MTMTTTRTTTRAWHFQCMYEYVRRGPNKVLGYPRHEVLQNVDFHFSHRLVPRVGRIGRAVQKDIASNGTSLRFIIAVWHNVIVHPYGIKQVGAVILLQSFQECRFGHLKVHGHLIQCFDRQGTRRRRTVVVVRCLAMFLVAS